MTTREILSAARSAKGALALADTETRNRALLGMADALCDPARRQAILAANAEDLDAARGHISEVMLDRLALSPARLDGMADGIRDVAALALKSGNACILRCGREAWRSSRAIVDALRQGVRAAGLPETAVCLIEDTTHASANELMAAVGYVDLLIPRGGAGLIRACVENAKVPCIQTGTGICHIYVDDTADQDKALDIIENAKASRPSVCNAAENLIPRKRHAPL